MNPEVEAPGTRLSLLLVNTSEIFSNSCKKDTFSLGRSFPSQFQVSVISSPVLCDWKYPWVEITLWAPESWFKTSINIPFLFFIGEREIHFGDLKLTVRLKEHSLRKKESWPGLSKHESGGTWPSMDLHCGEAASRVWSSLLGEAVH